MSHFFDCHCHLPYEPVNTQEYTGHDYLKLKESAFFVEEMTSYLGLFYPGNKDTFKGVDLVRPAVADEKAMDALYSVRGIEKAVVSAFWASSARNVDILRQGNALTARLCREFPGRFWGGCVINPHLPNESNAEIDKYLQDGRFAILGEVCPYLQNFDVASDLFAPFAQRAAELDVPVLVRTVNTEQQQKLLSAAKEHPRTRFIMSNMGGGRTFEKPHLAHQADNIFLDFSGIYATYIHGQLQKTVDAFGEERVLWGSDFPSVEPACTLATVQNAGLPARIMEKILWKNLEGIAPRLRGHS